MRCLSCGPGGGHSPLDEVWLSEPERRDRLRSLDKQRQRNEVQQRDLATKDIKPTKARHECPLLVKSDCESNSNSDSLPNQDQDFESGRDKLEDKDLWSDHPVQQVDTAPPKTCLPLSNLQRKFQRKLNWLNL